MKFENIKAVIFDLDGTLLDSLEDLMNSCNFAMSSFNFPLRTMDEVRQFVGNGYAKLIERACPKNTDAEILKKACECGKDYYSIHCLDTTKPYDGILNLLDQLKNKNIKIGVVSNKPDAEVKKLCNLFFKDYVQKDQCFGENEAMGIKKKPAPDSVLKTVQNMNLKPEECIYAGDSEVDILTAKNSGMNCISVDWGFRPKEYLMEMGATVLISHPLELLDLIC